MTAHFYSPGPREAEAGLWVQGQAQLHSEFHALTGWGRPCLQNGEKEREKIRQKKREREKTGCVEIKAEKHQDLFF